MNQAQPSAKRGLLGLSRGNALHSVFLLALLPILWTASGCKKSEPGRPTPASIHSITRELADAVRAQAPAGTQIRISPPVPASDSSAADQLDITIFSDQPDSSAGSKAVRIEQSLDKVATQRGLTKQRMLCREGICFDYLKSGTKTHSIYIHMRSQLAQRSVDTGNPPAGAKLAIILDDLGSDRAAAEAIFDLPYPLTISVLPNHEHSSEIAEEAERRGYQVMLHLPMQAIANERPEAQELRAGMPATQVSTLVDGFLQGVPGAVGVNNHQGSQATSDPALMAELMPVLRDRHLFYIDSRTTPATVAYDTAHAAGLPSAFRNVPFLDDVPQVGAVRKQLELAVRGAREKGQAVAIGHPHPGTLQALREFLPNAQAQGIRLVFASDLVH